MPPGDNPIAVNKYIISQNIFILQEMNEQHDFIWNDIAVKSACIMTTNIIIIYNAVNYFVWTSTGTTWYIYIIRYKCLYVSQNNTNLPVNLFDMFLFPCIN